MGSGIAPQIKKKYPNACKPYFNDKRTPEEKLGTCLVGQDMNGTDSIAVAHLYGQLRYGNNVIQTDYNAFATAFTNALKMLTNIEYIKGSGHSIKIGLPHLIGCGLAGGDWGIVESIILEASSNFNIDIWMYKFTP
jgi:O-acetyl-ADP-ribose deacetylase (regulator of RNase III)